MIPDAHLTGSALHVPDVDVAAALTALDPSATPGGWATTAAVGPDRAAAVLGRKGLLAKEPATRLALCAVHRALGWEPGRRPDGVVDPGTAVVACGVLGAADAVARVARTVADEGPRGVSVLDAPNVSANVLASTVALWFGFGGPNLHVCSGAAAGLDGLRLAVTLLRARRADRVVLVGAEPGDATATALHAAASGPDAPPLRATAAALVLEPVHASSTGPVVSGPVDGPVAGRDLPDITPWWGDAYGARGVLELALAAGLVADGAPEVVVGEPGGTRRAVVGAGVPARADRVAVAAGRAR